MRGDKASSCSLRSPVPWEGTSPEVLFLLLHDGVTGILICPQPACSGGSGLW